MSILKRIVDINWDKVYKNRGSRQETEKDGVYTFTVPDKKHKETEARTGFTISPGERKQIAEWLAEHNKTCKYHDDGTQASNPCGAIGGRLTYSFTPTGLGLITEVACACGDKIDVTEFEDW